MKILAVAFAYNEAKYIQDFIDNYRANGCQLFIVDNHSDDGTTDILKRNGVESVIIPTGGAFDLIKLQNALVAGINNIKPDWVVYTGIDIRYCLAGTIEEEIDCATAEGCNMIGVNYYNVYSTGEKFELPMHSHFFYGRYLKRLYMIARYQNPFHFEADSIRITNKKIFQSDGCLLNYGNCKPAVEREETYRRRKKAWERGLDQNYGVHYHEGHERGWTWTKSEMVDIRTTEHWKYILKL